MEKLEKVIAGLEVCLALKTTGTHVGCPYRERDSLRRPSYPECMDELNRDALEVVRGLEKKYATALEMAAIATERAAARTGGDLISRSELLKFPIRRDHYDRENGNPHFINGIETVMEYAETLPAVDAEPVVRGRWEVYCGGLLKCPVCGYEYSDYLECKNYCGNCGAHMDEEVVG